VASGQWSGQWSEAKPVRSVEAVGWRTKEDWSHALAKRTSGVPWKLRFAHLERYPTEISKRTFLTIPCPRIGFDCCCLSLPRLRVLCQWICWVCDNLRDNLAKTTNCYGRNHMPETVAGRGLQLIKKPYARNVSPLGEVCCRSVRLFVTMQNIIYQATGGNRLHWSD